MELKYIEGDEIIEWNGSERELQEYLLSTCGTDIRFEFEDLANNKKQAIALLTTSGDFHVEINDDEKLYIKPRTRLTIVEGGKVDVSAIVDIDARELLAERMELIQEAIAGV